MPVARRPLSNSGLRLPNGRPICRRGELGESLVSWLDAVGIIGLLGQAKDSAHCDLTVRRPANRIDPPLMLASALCL